MIFMNASEYSTYRPYSGGTSTAPGQRESACQTGMPARTPRRLTGYVAASTIPWRFFGSPQTISGVSGVYFPPLSATAQLA